MANTLMSILKKPSALNFLAKINNGGLATIYAQDVRHLYSKSTLGVDGFQQHAERVKAQLSSISDKFREKMSEYVVSESKNMIFTEDLKNMVHIAESDADIELAIEMLKRYNKQNKSLRFGNFIFGPVVFRMLYVHNKPDLALECFKSEEFSGLFDQYITFQLVLDLLYENQRYQDMLEVFEIIKQRQLEGQKYPRNVVVLVLAACYKQNSSESLDYALKLWGELTETGHQPTRRATTFCAALALNQGKPDIALEILTSVRNQNYTTVRNLKAVALAEIGRVDDVIPILKQVLNEDQPQGTQVHTFNRDTLERVKAALANANNPELMLEFNRLEQIFNRQGHISEMTLDEQLCKEIQKPPRMDSRQGQDFLPFRRPDNREFEQRQRRGGGFRQRPGLAELV